MNLELTHSFFPEVSVKGNPRYDPSGRNDGLVLSAAFSMGLTEKDPRVAYAQLNITTLEDECDNEPYRITVTAFALLKNADGTSINTLDIGVRRMAAQALVGSARELITIVTSRGPFPGFSFGFIPFAKISGVDPTEDGTPTSPKPTGKGVKASGVTARPITAKSIKAKKITAK